MVMYRFLIASLVSSALLVAGCDSAGEKRSGPPDIDRVELRFISMDSRFVHQTIIARRTETGDVEAEGRVVLEPGEYEVGLNAFDENESVADYVVSGPDTPLLRYALTGGLSDRLALREFEPTLIPMDTIIAPLGQAHIQGQGGPVLNTSPVPRPRFYTTVTDTAGTAGTLRLVLERYKRFSAYREGADPLRIDFDARFSLRTVPSAQK